MKKEPIISWDTAQIEADEVRYLTTEEGLSEEEARERLYNSDIYSSQWDFLIESLTEVMRKITKNNTYKDRWKVQVNNFGWRSLNGEAEIRAETGRELLEKVLPKTDCTFNIFKHGRNGLKIQNFHHDSPMGNEWYYITPMTRKEVETDE